MHSENEEPGKPATDGNPQNFGQNETQEREFVKTDEDPEQIRPNLLKDEPCGFVEEEPTAEQMPQCTESVTQDTGNSTVEAPSGVVGSEPEGEIHPYFSLNKPESLSPQSSHLSRSTKGDRSSIPILVIFLLGSFSICSAMLNLYLFWQARNLGAEIERLKPPTKSGLAPRNHGDGQR